MGCLLIVYHHIVKIKARSAVITAVGHPTAGTPHYSVPTFSSQVKRLRSAQSTRPVVAGGDGRDTAETSMNESASVQPPTTGADFFMRSDSPREPREVARTGDGCARQGIQGEWRESPVVVDDLRAKVTRLEVCSWYLSGGGGVTCTFESTVNRAKLRGVSTSTIPPRTSACRTAAVR